MFGKYLILGLIWMECKSIDIVFNCYCVIIYKIYKFKIVCRFWNKLEIFYMMFFYFKDNINFFFDVFLYV